MKKSGALVFPLSLLLFPFFAGASTGCTFEPFTTTLKQGESATIAVTVALPDATASYELSLGNMPLSVSGGFSAASANASSIKNLSLLINSKSDAQIGSFMIPILCRISSVGNVTESITQFNLVVTQAEKKTASTAQTPAQSAAPATSQTVSFGAIAATTSSALKESFDLSIKKAAAERAITSKSPVTANKGSIVATLQRGSRGAQVTLLQQLLQELKFFPADIAPTGYFGPVTKEAVEKFQEEKGIEKIGIVGPKTRAILNASQ